MRAKAGFFIIIGLLFMVASATADPLTATSSTSKSWVIANGVDTAEITLRVTNTSLNTAVQGAQITFTVVGDPTGSITPGVVTTDASGTAKSTFKANKKSGTAKIEARVTVTDATGTYTTIKTFDQNIDHDTPYLTHFEYPREGTVASEVPFRVSVTDQWGNLIDNRKAGDIHTIRLHVHGPGLDDCGFNDGAFVQDIARALDANGNATVLVRLSSKTGSNTILMDAFGNIPEKIEWIMAVSRGPPYTMTQEIDPAAAVLPADGDPAHKFTLKYTLFDEFGNPASDQPVWVNTSIAGEEQRFSSTSLGTVWVTYGPRVTTGQVTITATAVANTSVSRSKVVGFYNTSPVSMELTATPDSMASLDVNPATSADIMAKVVDALGNPVAGERVAFSLGAASYTEPYQVTRTPALAPVTTVTTDAFGFAIIKFYPGAFTTNISDPNYNPAATGKCAVTAVWNGQTKNIQLSWKNNPYLSVKTSLNPQTVEVNQTVDITIEVRGDGWALRPDPIDVVLVTDRSDTMNEGTKIADAKVAAKTFNGEMSDQDRVGLVSFGGEMATVDLTLSSDRSRVNTTIDSYSAEGNTPFRSAIYYATKMIDADPRSGAVKALVFMTDGEWNVNGDPEGIRKLNILSPEALSWPEDNIESTTDVVLWSKDKGIKIYTVGLGLVAGSQAETDLKNYASKTGGKYYSAATSSDLIRVYTIIAGELKTTAGVNTVMNLNFDSINVNEKKMSGSQVFSYNYTPYNPGPPVEGSTRIAWQDGVTNVTDQSADWAADQKLDFTIGTMEIGQVWQATIRLKTNQSGSIDVFAPGSQISFDGGKGYLEIPRTFLTVVPKLERTDMGKRTITLENLTCTEKGEIRSLLPVQWDTKYDGKETVTERIYYSIDDGPWVQFAEKIVTPPFSTDFTVLPVEKLPPGAYMIKIDAEALGAATASATLGPIRVNGPGKTYIKLE